MEQHNNVLQPAGNSVYTGEIVADEIVEQGSVVLIR
jgi:hypothetical protein